MKPELQKELAQIVGLNLQRASLRVPFFFQGNNPIELRPFADPAAARELAQIILADIMKALEKHEYQTIGSEPEGERASDVKAGGEKSEAE